MCDNNLLNTLDVEGILEAEYPEVAVVNNECLNYCGTCKLRPYAMVNGKRIFAKTPEECLEKVKDRINLELAAYMY